MFVEDAHTLDHISAGVIRACLEHCSIPLVVMMTHRRDDAALAAMDSEGKLAGKLANDATAAGARVARVASSRAASGTDLEGPISSDDSHPDGGLSSGGLSSGRDDVWGLKVSADLARHAGASAAASRRDNFEWMLEQYATTVVDVAALSRSDLRELVEVFAAERLIPRGGASRGVVTSGGKLGNVSSGADGASSGSDHSSTSGDGRKVLQRRSGRDANRQRLNRSHFVGLPIALHGAVYKQTGGDPLFARFVVALLVSSGAIAATTNANGVVDVTVRSDDSSVADIVSLSFRDAVLRVVDRAISKDARVAVKTLACCGDAFDAAFAHEMVARAIAEADAAELDADDGAFTAEDRAKSLSRVDRAGENDPGRPAVPHDVEMAYAAAARCERAGAAILELRREGFLVVDFGATEEAFVVADALYSEAHVEFAHADASFPVARPPALRAWADARERTSVSGSAWSGVELGLESRAPWICFANASTRVDVYDALPAASRRVAHLDAWRTLRARAQHAEDALTDAAGASALLERSADHLAVALALDRATLRRWTTGQHGDGRDGGSSLGLRRLRIGLGPGAMAVSDADSGASPGEVVAALSGYEARLSCYEKSAAASLRRGAIRSALTSVAAAGAAAAAWSEASRAATRAYQRSRAAALAERGDALVTPESAKTLLIRNAAWAALAARLAADVGDAHPPLLCAAADEHAVAPARAARRAFRALDIKWPLAASAIEAGGAAAELAAIRDVRLLLPDEFLRRDEGREGDEKEKMEKKKSIPANAEDDDGPCGGCFGISVSRGFGATGLRASLRDALFASVRDDALDALASEALSAKARAAAPPPTPPPPPWAVRFRFIPWERPRTRARTTARARRRRRRRARRSRRSRRFFSPLADVSPGVADVLHYASQIKPGISRETRLWAKSELALVAVSDLALSAVIAGRPTPAARALVAHARAFCDAPNPRAVDAALFLNLAAAMCPQGRRASALDRAAGVLETEARRLREARDREDAAECSARAPGFREAVRSRASDADGTVATESSVPATVAAAEKLKGPHRRRKVRFAQTPPPPRAGPALLARTLACCNQGDWVAARARGGRRGAARRRRGRRAPGGHGPFARRRRGRAPRALVQLPRLRRGTRQGSRASRGNRAVGTRRSDIGDDGDGASATRDGVMARRDARAAARGFAPLRRGVFREGGRGGRGRRRGGEAHARVGGVPSLRRAGVVVVGRTGRGGDSGGTDVRTAEDVARARALSPPGRRARRRRDGGARVSPRDVGSEKGKETLGGVSPVSRRQSREAPALRRGSRGETQTSRAREVPLTRRAKRKGERRRAMREDGRRREKTRGGGGARNAIGAQPRETEATRRRLRATTESRASTSGVIHITSAVFTNRGGDIASCIIRARVRTHVPARVARGCAGACRRVGTGKKSSSRHG